ncbi:hypothetical protein [Geotalea uraniireducens]|uniref:hypothetical protein n=1 Tax=Geotalea uraniireducens TaxID=351604 RepID=UPI002491E118|nr:hypothetical protein [Geotalea uraniireducens]
MNNIFNTHAFRLSSRGPIAHPELDYLVCHKGAFAGGCLLESCMEFITAPPVVAKEEANLNAQTPVLTS